MITHKINVRLQWLPQDNQIKQLILSLQAARFPAVGGGSEVPRLSVTGGFLALTLPVEDVDETEKEERSSKQGNEVEKPSDEVDPSETKESAEEEVAQDTSKDKEISEPLEKKTADTKITKHEVKDKGCEDLEEVIKPKVVSKSAQLKSSLKPKAGLLLPKGLTVTVSPVVKEQSQSDSARLGEGDEITALRSEEAKTPVHEEHLGFQGLQTDVTAMPDLISMGEPVMADEAAQLQPTSEEADTPAEEEKEPEFDYYGCETCKAEAKPIDKFNFNHKCPICPCVCFCAHLLKEHMKIIHGWFNVQRRFTQF
ncbi:hypothetical protein J6590_040986 [Homalodisca vitripennis]|nr:hypothetical protein J6590_040986 [Homalodisca vitripennis]